jgi:hypothetical protein
MASPHFNIVVVSRSAGKSSVHGAAYAAREDLTDERTGITYRYARKNGDIVASWVWVPKEAPARFRNRATLWNEVEKAEKRKDAQLARRIILALPHELTAEQQQHLLKDYVRENFVRKGLAVDVSIHKPDPKGDERNDHAHIQVTTRFLGAGGFGEKDRDSNGRQALLAWRKDWEKKVNRQLERYGHDARISMDTLEAQGIDREPQLHQGQGATALERKGIQTERGDMLRDIANDNDKRRTVANDLGRAVGREDLSRIEERRRGLLAAQTVEWATFERDERSMAARHAESWGEAIRRHTADAVSHLPENTAEEAGEAVSHGLSFFLSLFTSWAESITRSIAGAQSKPSRDRSQERKKDAERRERERKAQQQRDLEGMMAEHVAEREQWERRRQDMLQRQAKERGQFEQEVREKSSLQQAFERQGDTIESYREALTAWEKQRVGAEARSQDKGAKRDGPELGG